MLVVLHSLWVLQVVTPRTSQIFLGKQVYSKSSIKPLGGLFILSPFEGGLTETGGLLERGGGLFHLEMTMVSVLHKELEYKVEKFK